METTTKTISDTNGSQTIAHGLGVIPKFIRLTGDVTANTSEVTHSEGTYNGSTTASVTFLFQASNTVVSSSTSIILRLADTNSANGVTGIATFDATNITITWTSLGTGNSAVANIMWEAQA